MKTASKRRIVVTTALIYANGDLHLGHLVETIQADIWARFQRMRGHECWTISGSDAHGTPIMLSAEKAGIKPEDLIQQKEKEHEADFKAFDIHFDSFCTTHSADNSALTEAIYAKLNAKNDIETRTIAQAYDTVKEMFLPDRYIKGECPRCHTKDQYGDSCEHCGATYSPLEMINPISTVSQTKPMEKCSEHYFFKLTKYESILKNWLDKTPLQPEIKNKLQEWFEGGLKDWDISRDAPYFGFEIPGKKDKYFYVWLDAPIGYIANLGDLAKHNLAVTVEDFFSKDASDKTELYHFIGKDIMYFHVLFWPAILVSAGYRLPTNVYVHGFLTINGEKMSKSRGTFISAKSYLAHLDPAYLRYYFFAKLSNNVADIDLNWVDFQQRVNADLVGKVVNIASRCTGFIHKYANGRLAPCLPEQDLYQLFARSNSEIAQFFEEREFSQAARAIMHLADLANQYIDSKKPWSLAKESGQEALIQAICTQGLNLFRVLMIYLKPVLPAMATAVETFLQINPLVWEDCNKPLLSHSIAPFTPLMQRIQNEDINPLISQQGDHHS
ncbi:MAG: methionine--tRNA ligase [Gammaproteobacteria bacterium]|jgi:methionyl-tRNA synthetase|nr:methionine--tRNA ligase [Gammaproteobacteria bacterium]